MIDIIDGDLVIKSLVIFFGVLSASIIVPPIIEKLISTRED